MTEPIIHPERDEQKDHIRFRAYRFYDKTPLGKKTIEVVNLNDRERLVTARFNIGERIREQLDFLEDDVLDFQNGINTSARRKTKITTWMKNLLNEALPNKEYAATAATVLLNEPLFFTIKTSMETCELWDEEMETLATLAQTIALEVF